MRLDNSKRSVIDRGDSIESNIHRLFAPTRSRIQPTAFSLTRRITLYSFKESLLLTALNFLPIESIIIIVLRFARTLNCMNAYTGVNTGYRNFHNIGVG